MKANTTSPATIKSNEKLSLIAMLLLFFMSSSSCFKSLDEPMNRTATDLYETDKRVFFTMRSGTDSFATYGIQKINDPNTTGWDSAQSIKVTNEKDATGSDYTVLKFTISYVVNVPYLNSSGSIRNLELGNCVGQMSMFKKGNDQIGKYTSLSGIADLITGVNTLIGNPSLYGNPKISLTYEILEKDFSCEITAAGALPSGKKYLEGIFTCKAFKDLDSSMQVPVSGSFRLYKQ